MTLNQSALLQFTEALRTADNGDVMRQMLGFMLQALVDAEATSVIGAAAHQRTEDRVTHRNGTRPKTVSTTAGDLTVKIPKLRTGSFFPSLLEPRRRVDVALHAVIMEAYVHGVSTRKVDDLVSALGVDTGISKSEVSRIYAGLDAQVADRRYLTEGSMVLLNPPAPTALAPATAHDQEVIDTPTAVTASTNQQSATRRYLDHATGLDLIRT